MNLALADLSPRTLPFALQGSSLIARTEVVASTLGGIATNNGLLGSGTCVTSCWSVGPVDFNPTVFNPTVQAVFTTATADQCGSTAVAAPIVDYISAGIPADPSLGLRDIVSAIKESRALPSTPAFEELLARAVSRQPNGNIKLWAQRLAEDVGDLND
jgi:hypothetical protein